MPIRFKCPSCSKLIQAADTSAGKSVKCPQCETVMKVPGGATPTPAAAPSPPAPVSNPFDSLPSVPAQGFPAQSAPYRPPNPYQPTVQPLGGGGSYSAPSAGNPLMGPGIALITLATIHLLIIIVTTVIAIFVSLKAPPQPNSQNDLIISLVSTVIGVVVQGLILYGGVSMLKLQNRGAVTTALILSVIPCFCSSMAVLGIPFGIWGLVAMNNPVVTQRFR